MSTTEAPEQTIAPWDPDEPLMSHTAEARVHPEGSWYKALCGARLIGEKAPPGHEPRCEICKRLWWEYIASDRFLREGPFEQ